MASVRNTVIYYQASLTPNVNFYSEVLLAALPPPHPQCAQGPYMLQRRLRNDCMLAQKCCVIIFILYILYIIIV